MAVDSRQTKLNFLSGLEWVVGRVLREVADLAVEVGELLQVGRLLEEWTPQLVSIVRGAKLNGGSCTRCWSNLTRKTGRKGRGGVQTH